MTEDASKAQDENAGMLNGVVPIYSADQNSFAHAIIHIGFMAAQYNSLQQGQIQPQDYLKYVQPAVQHIQVTLQAIQGDKTKGSQVQELYNQFQKLVSESQAVSQQFSQQQKAAQAQQQADAAAQQQATLTGQLLDPQSRLKLARIQADNRLDTMETVAKIHNQTAKTAASIAEKQAKTRQELAVNDVKTSNEIRNRNRKAK